MEKFNIIKKQVVYSKFNAQITRILGYFDSCFDQEYFEVRFDFPERKSYCYEPNYHCFYFRNFYQARKFLNRFTKRHSFLFFRKYYHPTNSRFCIELNLWDNAINRITMRNPSVIYSEATLEEIIDWING